MQLMSLSLFLIHFFFQNHTDDNMSQVEEKNQTNLQPPDFCAVSLEMLMINNLALKINILTNLNIFCLFYPVTGSPRKCHKSSPRKTLSNSSPRKSSQGSPRKSPRKGLLTSPRKSLTSPRKSILSSPSKPKTPAVKKVGLLQISNVISEVYGSRITSSSSDSQTFPVQQKLIICTVLLMVKRGKFKEVTLGKVSWLKSLSKFFSIAQCTDAIHKLIRVPHDPTNSF